MRIISNGQLSNGARSRLRGVGTGASQIVFSHLIPDRKRITLYSIQNLKRLKPAYFQEDLRTLFNLLARKKIKPLIAAQFPLHEARLAHEMLADGVRGKIVLVCSS